MNLYLIDGTYELFRAYYGAPEARVSDGLEVGATRGLLRSLLVLLREQEPLYVACAFDHVIESFRNDLFEGYKTGAGIEPELLSQFPLAERAARALGIVVWPMVEFEADDALATAAHRWSRAHGVDQTLLCTPDKDLAQSVVANRVVLWDRRRRKTLDERGVLDKFGVLPGSIPDWLALVGDSADGIPGVPRWGAKAASTLLRRYGSIEAIPARELAWDVDIRGKKALAYSLRTHRQELELYKVLATLRRDVPLEQPLPALRWRGAHRSELAALCEEIGEPEILGRVPRWSE